MEQFKPVESSEPGEPGRTPGKKKTPHNHTKGNHQNNGHNLNGLDKYFQVLPVVESFLNISCSVLVQLNISCSVLVKL